jgi:hypothetical protein
MESAFYKRQRLGARMFYVSSSLTLSLIIFNLTTLPRFPMYIYSLIPENEDNCWLRVISSISGWLTTSLFTLSEGQVEILFPAFARSVNHCLEVIMLSEGPPDSRLCKNCEDDDQKHHFSCDCWKLQILDQLEKSLDQYEKLEALISEFNKIFSWPIIMYKSSAIVKMCSYAYIILKHSDSSGMWGYLIFPYALVILSSKVGIILSSFGSVEHQTELYFKSWKRIICELDQHDYLVQKLERRLQGCTKFGITCGNFYTVYPHTILTFYSVTLTYLIIMLQL